MKTKWYGMTPKTCEICNKPLKKVFIDGRTDMGAWAIMCEHCHRERGVGLGIGKGQRYELKIMKDSNKEWIKIIRRCK